MPGGLGVRSYNTLDTPDTVCSEVTISLSTYVREECVCDVCEVWRGRTVRGRWSPGVAGMPVIKSEVMKVRITTER